MVDLDNARRRRLRTTVAWTGVIVVAFPLIYLLVSQSGSPNPLGVTLMVYGASLLVGLLWGLILRRRERKLLADISAEERRADELDGVS